MLRLHGGCFRAHGRADDTMNLGGIKVSSVELETAIARHPVIAECAAIAVQPGGEGADRLVVYAVLEHPEPPENLQAELGRLIASELNPLFKIHDVVITDSLPRTASNKLMRRTLRSNYLARSSCAEERRSKGPTDHTDHLPDSDQ
jgi:acetyl-CoA synthetase